MLDMEALKAAQREHKIRKALEALPQATGGDWWCSASGELLSDPIGNVKVAKHVSGMHAAQAGANRCLLEAARELAEEVLKLRAAVPASNVVVARKDLLCALGMMKPCGSIEVSEARAALRKALAGEAKA